MMRCGIALGSLFFVLILSRAAAADDPHQRDASDEPSAQGYSSPQRVHEAYRQACDEDDWRTVFYCLTPASRDSEVFVTFDGCTFRHEDPKVAAAMKKYGLDQDAVMKEYTRRYRNQHGVDLDKLGAEIQRRQQERFNKRRENQSGPANGNRALVPVPGPDEGETPEPSLPPVDYRLMREVVLQFVTDKPGFYEEANRALWPAAKDDTLRPSVGALQGVVIRGDRATGWVIVTRHHLGTGQDGITRREAEPPIRQSVQFRKLNGGWFMGE
jgi:hypothetical protein